jgi:hypothetical protein
MSYYLNVIKDSPIGFWKLDESSGTIASDSSGCGNNGTYSGSPIRNILPLIPGGGCGTKINSTSTITFPITNNYYAATTTPGMATKYSSDNDFTIEAWVYIDISNNATPNRLFADTNSGTGLYWENGDIVFRAEFDEVRHAVTYSKKVLHVVGVYSPKSISLYVDGVLVASTELNSFKFTNTNVSFIIGPTQSSLDTFTIDSPAIYRYALKEENIKSHYLQGNISSSAIQVAFPDQGVLFSGTDAQIKTQFQYSYPINKQWQDFVDDNTYYDRTKGCISFYPSTGAKTFIIEDSFLLPSQIGLITSKVEWRNNLGISVESSIDGVNYLPCVNGRPLPQYSKLSFSTANKVYFRITMSTSDSSKHFPRLSFFAISFYNNNDLYADNYGDKISSTSDYYLGSLNYPILSRNEMNGIRPKLNSGFDISTISQIKSIEFFLTPADISQANILLYAPAAGSYSSEFKWAANGTISKTNIQAWYVNGVDKTAITSISSVLANNEPAFITIVFTNPISTTIRMNYNVSGSPLNLYNVIAIYEKEITSTICLNHYNAYVGKPLLTVNDQTVTLTESDTKYYNNEWVVIQTV